MIRLFRFGLAHHSPVRRRITLAERNLASDIVGGITPPDLA
jgi:hypothetical protein